MNRLLMLCLLTVSCNDYVASLASEPLEASLANETIEIDPPVISDNLPSPFSPNSGKKRLVNDKELNDLGIDHDMAIATLSKTFTANPTRDNALTIDFRAPAIDSLITLTSKEIISEESFEQVVRPVYHQQFFQSGAVGNIVEENFTQDEKGVLDILLVIDNSISMRRAQYKLSTKLSSLLNYLSDSNWRMAVTTTDRSNCLARIIDKETPNYEEVFENTIIGLGTKGAGDEEAILMATRALKGECNGQINPWLRENSSIAVVIVSDEDHQCYRDVRGWGEYRKCYDPWDDRETRLEKVYRPIDEFYSHLQKITARSMFAVYGILNTNNRDYNRNPDNTSRLFESWRSKENASRHQGQPLFSSIANIFSDDYNSVLQEISHDISVNLKDQFALSRTPDFGTLKVEIIDGDTATILHPTEYHLLSTTLTLENAPPQGSEIKVSYAYNSRPFIRNFVLPHPPLAESLAITTSVAGEVTEISDSQYRIKGRKIAFNTAPPKDAVIDISYQENIPLQKSFTLNATNVKNLQLTIDYQPVTDFHFDQDTNTIVFDDEMIPAEGSIITASYHDHLEDTLHYPLVVQDDYTAFDCFAKRDPAFVFTCQHQEVDGQHFISFVAEEFQPNIQIIVRQHLDATSNNIQLAQHYLADTIVLSHEAESCSATQLVIDDNTLTLDNQQAVLGCSFLIEDLQGVILTYQHVEVAQSFSAIKSFFDSHNYEYEHWHVTVNGEHTEDFTITDHAIEFNEMLPADSLVEIQISLY